VTDIGRVPLVTSGWLPHHATVTHELPEGGVSSEVTLQNAGRAHEAMTRVTRMTKHRQPKDMATLSTTSSSLSNVVVYLGEWVPAGQEDLQRLLCRLQTAAPSVATTIVVNLSRQEIQQREEAEEAMQSAAQAAERAIKADAERKKAAAIERARYGGAWSDDEDVDALGPEAQAAVDNAAAVSVQVSALALDPKNCQCCGCVSTCLIPRP